MTFVMIAGCCIERVNDTKFLGIIIDSKLSWKKHIDYVAKLLKTLEL